MLTISSVWTVCFLTGLGQRRIHPKTGSTLAIKVPPLSPDLQKIIMSSSPFRQMKEDSEREAVWSLLDSALCGCAGNGPQKALGQVTLTLLNLLSLPPTISQESDLGACLWIQLLERR